MSRTQWQFEEFRLDQSNQCLWHGDERITLRPKTYELLLYLIEHPDQLIAKEELLDKVWVDKIVVEGVLSTSIAELRKVFGESAKQPRFIETVHRRGYRFIVPVSKSETGTSKIQQTELSFLIGRQEELARLRAHYEQVQQSNKQVVFITGEAGIGKSALINAFTAQFIDESSLCIAHGQCIEHYGSGEAYLPLLDITGNLAQSSEGTAFIELLIQYAPSWLTHLPALTHNLDPDLLKQRVQGASQERMLRELAEVLEVFASTRVLILILEDLHWCDVSTLSWLTYMARRRNPCKIQLLASFRPSDAIATKHPIHDIAHELFNAKLCHPLSLAYFSESAVLAYLVQHRNQLIESKLSANKETAGILYQRTNGNPLFLTAIVNAVTLIDNPSTMDQGIPDNLLQLINRQLGTLNDDERVFVEAASVVGKQFSAALISASVALSLEKIEEIGFALAHRQQFIQNRGNKTWPDGTVSATYVFVHDLFREGIYEQIPINKRIRWHRIVAERLESAHQENIHLIAAELAVHHAQSNNPVKAAEFMRTAGQAAVQINAYREAIAYYQKSLEILQQRPVTSENIDQQLQIQLALNSALVADKGYGATEVEQAYRDTLELSRRHGIREIEFPALWGLWDVHLVRAEINMACDSADQLLNLADASQNDVFLLQAHSAAAQSYCHAGHFSKGKYHLQQIQEIYDPKSHHSLTEIYGEEDPALTCLLYSCQIDCLIGFPEKATLHLRQAYQLVEDYADPYSEAYALFFGIFLHYHRGDINLLKRDSDKLVAVAERYDIQFWLAYGVMAQGWSLCREGEFSEGLLRQRTGIDLIEAGGAAGRRPFFLVPLINTYIKLGELTEALKVTEEALALCHCNGEEFFESELHRINGNIILECSESDKQHEMAEASFQKAITVAQNQEAKFFELRATVSLCRLWKIQGKFLEAHLLLRSVVDWFTEDGDFPDLIAAKSLLVDLVQPVE